MAFDRAVRLGPFMVDETGGITPPRGHDARFTVKWRGCVMHAALRAAGGEAAAERIELRMLAVLGRVPSTAAPDGARRDAVLAMLREANRAADGPLRLGLSADHRVLMRERRDLVPPLTSRSLIAEVTGFVLGVAPYLDFAAESGVTPAGMAKT